LAWLPIVSMTALPFTRYIATHDFAPFAVTRRPKPDRVRSQWMTRPVLGGDSRSAESWVKRFSACGSPPFGVKIAAGTAGTNHFLLGLYCSAAPPIRAGAFTSHTVHLPTWHKRAACTRAQARRVHPVYIESESRITNTRFYSKGRRR
jgi:hypothetical protein